MMCPAVPCSELQKTLLKAVAFGKICRALLSEEGESNVNVLNVLLVTIQSLYLTRNFSVSFMTVAGYHNMQLLLEACFPAGFTHAT